MMALVAGVAVLADAPERVCDGGAREVQVLLLRRLHADSLRAGRQARVNWAYLTG